MPTQRSEKRGVRGKRKKNRELSRPAEQQATRLQQAINKRLTRNTLWCTEPNSACAPGASSSTTLPAEQQEQAPTGVTYVSVESDSDNALSPSQEGPLPEEEPASPTSPCPASCADFTKPRKEATQGLDRPDGPCTGYEPNCSQWLTR